MDQTLAERPSQEQHISQLHVQHSGTVNSSGTHSLQDPSARRWTGCRGTSTPRGGLVGDHLRQGRQIPLCRDNFRGTSCKYHHAESGEHGGSRFYQSELGGLGVSKLGNSQLYREDEDNNSKTRISSGGYRRRSPCRKLQSGRCYRGSSCLYLHPELVRYDKTTYNVSKEQQQVHGAVRFPSFSEGNKDNASRMSQGQEDAIKENSMRPMTSSVEHRRRSPCRNFLRGNCIFGSSCKRVHPVNTFDRSRTVFSSQHHQRHGQTASNPGCGEGNRDVTLRTSQGHDKSNMPNSSRTGAFLRELRRRSPCRNFLSGKCYRGESCACLHLAPVYDRSRHESWRTQRRDRVTVTTGTPHFNNGTVSTSSRIFQNHEDRNNHAVQPRETQCVYEESQARSTKDCMQLAGNIENMDVAVRSWSSERHRSRNASDFDGGKLQEPEVCLQFTRGRCIFGDSCRYLHDYHKYASSNYSTRPTEAAADSRTFGVANQYADTVMIQRHVGVKTATELSVSVTDGEKYEIPGEKIMDLCSSAETHEDISLWSQPFKKQIEKELAKDSIAVDMPRRVAANSLGDLESDSASLCEERVNTSKQQENGSIIDNLEKKVEPTLATAEVSRRKLLVLDVNGLLVNFTSEYPLHLTPDTIISTKAVFKRPFCDDFLRFCFERYDVGIWTSRIKQNVAKVVKFLMKDTQKRLLFCWDQSHCTKTGYSSIENCNKPLLLKELKNLWDRKEQSLPWKRGYYCETNTILLDDSPYKALRNPPYTAIFPYPYNFEDVQDKSLGPGGDLRVYLERLAEAANVQKFIQENPFGQSPITKAHMSWAFYAKIVGTCDGILLQEKVKVVGTSDSIQLEEKANVVGTSDGSQLAEDAEIVGTSNWNPIRRVD